MNDFSVEFLNSFCQRTETFLSFPLSLSLSLVNVVQPPQRWDCSILSDCISLLIHFQYIFSQRSFMSSCFFLHPSLFYLYYFLSFLFFILIIINNLVFLAVSLAFNGLSISPAHTNGITLTLLSIHIQSN